MLKILLFSGLIYISSPANAQLITVSQCSKDLTRRVFGVSDTKATEYCKKHKQKVIECAIEYYRTHKIGNEFEDAITECFRNED